MKSKTLPAVRAVAVGVGLCCAVQARGAVIPVQTWDAGPEPWHKLDGEVSLDWSSTGGNPNGWMPIVFPTTANPEYDVVGWEDVAYVNKEDFFAGNYANRTVSFDFYTANTLPQNLQLQFASTNGNVWGYNVTDRITQTQTWTTVQVPLGYNPAWGPLPAFDDTEEQFLADLAAIDWIGVYIFREGSSLESYGLDNFRLLVPEPSQLSLLAAALAVAVLHERRKRAAAAPRAGPPRVS